LAVAIFAIFVIAYAAIALEHPLGVSKSASALVAAGLLWTSYAMMSGDHGAISRQLDESVTSVAQIVFFLVGAMTIVEVINAHDGFEVITALFRTRNEVRLLWLVGSVTFFLSAILDNLTTTIVMVSLMQKLLGRREDRLLFASVIVIAANAGGAWSVIGDVTTTMLWIGGRVSSLGVMSAALPASIVSLLVPLAVISHCRRGRTIAVPQGKVAPQGIERVERNLMFYLGLGLLIAVPVFKAVTGLPPFMGVLFGLGILWLAGEIIHRHKDETARRTLSLAQALTRIDMSALVFFIGILLAVGCLEHAGLLSMLAKWLQAMIGRNDIIVVVLGLLSAVIDNVPLVAATMGMYDPSSFPADNFIWAFIAYCAGTGGSILIIGSAAGIAAMGIEKIEFFWYVRRVSLLALLGYASGALVYVLQYHLMH